MFWCISVLEMKGLILNGNDYDTENPCKSGGDGNGISSRFDNGKTKPSAW